MALSELTGIRAPTLVTQGDDDIVEVEHSAAFAATLPDAHLAVVPGTSHAAPLEKPDLVSACLVRIRVGFGDLKSAFGGQEAGRQSAAMSFCEAASSEYERGGAI